jgi:hypothetical protein
MKALPLLLVLLVLTGCSTTKMSEDDKFIWGIEPGPDASAAPAK